MQKLQNTYWWNYHVFYSNNIHNKHADRMFMAYAPILPLVSIWQHSIHIHKAYHSWGTWRQQFPPPLQQMIICQNCTNAISILLITTTNIRPYYSSTAYK